MSDQNKKKNKAENESEKSWPQVLAISVACIFSFSTALMFSWTSPFIVKITEDKENYNITEEEASYFTVLPPIGALCSSIIFFKLSDILGRKKTLMFFALPQIIFFVMTIFAKNVYVFYVARFISGLTDACLFTTLPMFVGEVATPKVRGTWGNLMTIVFYFGTLVVNIIGSYMGVRESAYIFLIFPVLFLIAIIFIPETPYFYVIKKKDEEAKKSLRWLRRKDDVELEFEQIKKDVERQLSESGSFIDLFKIASNRKSILVAVFLRIAQHMSGLMALQTYTTFIFKYAETDLSPSTSSIIYSAVLTILSPFSIFFVDNLGRKKSVLISLILLSLVLIAEGVYFYLNDYAPSVNLENLRWLPIVGICSWVLFFSIGMGAAPTLMLGELFSARVKSKALAVTNVINACSQSFQGFFFYFLTSGFGMYFPFMFYGVTSFLMGILTIWIVPETKGKTLEQIQQNLKGHKV